MSGFALGLPSRAEKPRLRPGPPQAPQFAGPGRAYSFEETDMESPTKEQIIHRAYELWEKADKPEGRDQEFYHQAELELRAAQKQATEDKPQ